MRIAHYYASFDPTHGGPPMVIAELSRALRELDCVVELVSSDSDGRQKATARDFLRARGLDGTHATLQRFDAIPLPTPGAVRTIRSIVGNADIVHIHGLWDLNGLMLARESLRAHRPYVVTLHGMLDRWSLRQKHLKKRIALAVGFRRMVEQASLVHLLNERERELIEGVRLRNSWVIPNGVPGSLLGQLPPVGSFRKLHPQIGDAPYIVFLSRLHYVKGLDLLAKAFEILHALRPDVHMVVIGPDEGALRMFEEHIVRARLASRVHVVGPLYGRAKVAALRDATVYCLPSRHECFSVSILEAMAAGVPCVVSEQCSFAEVAEHDTGRIVALEPRLIAAALTEILSDSHTAEAMGARGRELVLARYTWGRVAEQMRAAYASLLGASQTA